MSMDTQLWVHTTEPDRDEFEEPSNSDMFLSKPEGGLWTSTLRDDGLCAWIQWLDTGSWNPPDETRVFALEPDPDADVVEIASVDDLERLNDQFSRSSAPGSCRQHPFAPLDFEEIAEEYDAIHLTERGQLETRLSWPGLYGWDCESTCWLSWRFSEWELVGPVKEIT